jgi:hypothetical protein
LVRCPDIDGRTERAGDLSSEQVRRLHRSMHSTPVAANRMLGALSAVYG